MYDRSKNHDVTITRTRTMRANRNINNNARDLNRIYEVQKLSTTFDSFISLDPSD